MKRLLPLFFLGLAPVASAQIQLTANDLTVTESFDTFLGAGFSPTPTEGQLNSNAFAIDGIKPSSSGQIIKMVFGDSPTHNNFGQGISGGGTSAGGIYAFDTGGGDYALGVQPSGAAFSPRGAFFIRYQNATGGPVTTVNISYEIKFLNDQNRSSALNLRYAVDPACSTDDPLDSGLVYSTPSLGNSPDFATPLAADADPQWETEIKGMYLNDVALANGSCLLLRFESFDNGGSGSRDEFAIDDLAVTPNPSVPLPVELVSFEAVAMDAGATLRWETAGETNNAGFDVQQHIGGAWQTLGFVGGHGTTVEAKQYGYTVRNLAPGTHRFRLKQVDFDGAFEFSPEVELTVELSGRFSLASAYPNPTRDVATFALSVQRSQHVTVEVYNLLGRRVATLLDARLADNETRTLTIDAKALPAGVYVYRVQGEHFAASRQVTVLR